MRFSLTQLYRSWLDRPDPALSRYLLGTKPPTPAPPPAVTLVRTVRRRTALGPPLKRTRP